jgi:hypothetical protein
MGAINSTGAGLGSWPRRATPTPDSPARHFADGGEGSLSFSATDGLSHGAIAFRLGVSIGEVETALAGALSKLTEGLEKS